ncbi:MAG: ferritin-like domain-containing protein [Polyangiaceae bacterium]
MRTLWIRARILSAIGASSFGLVGCGSSGTVAPPDASTDAGPAQSAFDASDATPEADAAPDSSASDATADAPLSVRRPFLVGRSMRAAQPTARDDWGRQLAALDSALDERTRDALFRAWQRDGLEEHASIAAFARFTMLMLSVGAPPELVVGSQRASLDEVAHARACFALAARYHGTDVGPAPLDVHDSLGSLSLAELAALTAEEGCVGETLGAVLAQEQLACARDPEVVRMLTKLVADELRHAELAWRFVRWAIDRGGASVARAVERAAQRAITEIRRMPLRPHDVDLDAWHAHGRLTCEEARAASERGIQDVVEPCLEALAAKPRDRDVVAL